ncbi:3-hydroxyacyl-CoA dehydrogenase [Micromonospora olivasterospora]|uniref:NAD(P)-dependent dehydrogenase (Short-subunit alcohol dehydrogenase family) n=1 Tax=Micromonospora olivasterospora TaxID=1880 RepID=A0A562I3Q5_MICOL|nr:3-hydroxyacyl-CoA dehydrogenase [Micromonospora olivasterospora]TWH65305.1 NAD(P)-dependent dehydrogenase (short-subunit alcohol dehydrogenase family) [Micromonospora olivasterospora]
MDIAGSTALVTGGGSGLGLATVRRLHASGAKVVILDLPISAGREVAKELGDDVVFVAADVTDEDQVQAAVDAATALGGLSIVVNCAGIGPPMRVLGRGGVHPLPDFTKVVMVNLVGTFNVIRLASARMVEADHSGEERGVIVNTASVAAFDGQVGQAAYSASKGGIVGLTLPVARDLAQHRIRVNTIAPGLFLTPLFEALPQETIESLGVQVPHPARLGRPDEFAQLVQQIVENPMLNGETIRLDGAIRMAPR